MIVIKPSDWEKESAQLVSSNDLPDWVESEIKRYRSQGWIDLWIGVSLSMMA